MSKKSQNPDVKSKGLEGAGRLEHLRNRLLDLTTRNRLLSFNHRTRASLRIVDELPNQLYEELMNGNTLTFAPVSRPTNTQLIAYMEEKDEEEEPSAEQWACYNGIDTSYELPIHSASEKHADRKIQTLFYPQDLEARLRSLSRAARTAIEESGTNMLYLAFGFLQWLDSETSEVKRFAPLVLIPISIERGIFSNSVGTYSYKVSHSGEDILTNLSLKEKLSRDFGMLLPDLDEEETPELYIKKIERLIQGKSKWRVCRFVTTAMFHFGKLLMYIDLDPKRWPKGKAIEKHTIVRKFFEGNESSGQAQAVEYSIDSEPELTKLAPLIYDADSSQHSALIDAVQGKNLVVEGPPGSGKSQTITNLIAAALYSGKKILFISEKLAALEVVRRRLNEAGLGDFCLELHSHKTQKKGFLEDVDFRIKNSGQYRRPFELQNKNTQLERLKSRLKEHVAQINAPYGRIERSIHEIFCVEKYYGQKLGDLRGALDDYELDQAEEYIQNDIDEDEESLQVFCQAFRRVREVVEIINQHPWYGVDNIELQPFETPNVIQALSSWSQAAEAVLVVLTDLEETIGVELPSEEDHIRDLIQQLDALPVPQAHHILSLFPLFLQDPLQLNKLHSFIDLIKEIEQYDDSLAQVFNDPQEISQAVHDQLAQSLDMWTDIAEGQYTPDTINQIGLVLDQLVQQREEIETIFRELNSYWGNRLSSNTAGIKETRSIVQLCQEAPTGHLSMRDALFDEDGLDEVLNHMAQQIESIQTQEQTLSTQFNLSIVPSNAELMIAARNMANGGILRWFKADWREANRLYNMIVLLDRRGSIQQKTKRLHSLAQYKDRLDKFNEYEQGKQMLLHLFAGIETPIQRIRELKSWYDKVRAEFGFGFGSKAAIGEVLFTLPVQVIRGIAQMGDGPFLTRLEASEQSVNNLELLSSFIAQPINERGLIESGEYLNTCKERQSELSTALSEAGVISTIRISNISEGLARWVQWTNLISQAGDHQAARDLLGDAYNGTSTDIASIDDTCQLADEILQGGLPSGINEYLLNAGRLRVFEEIRQGASRLKSVIEEYDLSADTFKSLVHLNRVEWFGRGPDQTVPALGDVIHRAKNALESEQDFVVWLDYKRSRYNAINNKLQFFVGLTDQEEFPVDVLESAYRYCFYHTLSKQILRQYPMLRDFRGYQMNELRKRFIDADREILTLQRKEIAYHIDQRSIPSGISTGPVKRFTELGLLEHEIGKQKRHIPIRQLVHRAGKALQALKPCFMMGPLSVAQYLEAGALEFDIVVMDEASQMKPEDAMGAIARAKQIVVVGDPKQLPPTTFFDRMADEKEEDEEEETAIEQSESILDAAAPLFKPMRRLRWHYRSRHESLIAFSNKEFYNNDLVVFPSPHRSDKKYGVKFVPINGGVFRNRVNAREAKMVAQEAIKHMRSHGDESLGIVAMNASQKDLIETEVENLLKEDSAAQKYIEWYDEHHEPFFVKNLENVQGDERDVIYISFTYGPNEPGGPVMQRFGPINHELGWRRLNVLFTRAKNRVVAYASMSADNILVPANSRLGLRALKNYLAYAASGNLEQPFETGRPPDSEFEMAVAHALKLRGFECVAQVGVAGFYIDLAVKHPHYPGRYLLGIECDGATYHSGKSVRDRDRLRQDVLENLGWKIYRIWSTDWFKNPEKEIDEVIQCIETEQQRFKESKVTNEEVSDLGIDPTEAINTGDTLFTIEEGRIELLTLREEIREENPTKGTYKEFLCDEVVDMLLELKPTSKQDLLVKLPFTLRDKLDPEQFGQYNERVIDIIKHVVH